MSIKFTVFSDFHYEPPNGASRIEDMQEILDFADKSNSAFVLHCGDLHAEF